MIILRSWWWLLSITVREGSTVAAPIVRKVLEAYFELKQIDATSGRQ